MSSNNGIIYTEERQAMEVRGAMQRRIRPSHEGEVSGVHSSPKEGQWSHQV